MAATACFLHTYVPSTSKISYQRSSQQAIKQTQHTCRAQKQSTNVDDANSVFMSRRFALAALVGASSVGVAKVSPADAAFGEAANVFGKPKTNTEFMQVSGDGFKIQVPSKWSPSKEVEFPGQVLRYEDIFDTISNLSVMVVPTSNSSVTDYGTPEEFLSKFDYLLGRQAYSGKTEAEGGFDPFVVATANVLETATPVVGETQYYSISVLTRTADGDEGGKHQIITAAVKGGKLYICKAQAGDKRWFKGARKYVESASSSFNVA